MQEFKISELEKEVKEGEKRDAVDSADTRAAQRDLRRLQVPARISRQLFFVRNPLENATYTFFTAGCKCWRILISEIISQ